MAEHDTLTRKPRKFLFDIHNFDEPDKVEPEIEEPPPPPPPPTFSESELEAARQQGYERGRKDAAAEALASREKYIADLLAQIEVSFKTLFAEEQARAAAYEAESIQLTQDMFSKIFPALNEKHGLSEIEQVIARILESQRQQPEIIIEVAPEDAGEVRVLVERLHASLHRAGHTVVNGHPGLGKGDCRLSWHNGGAERSASWISSEIGRILQEMLADRPILHDNRKTNMNTGAQAAPQEDQAQPPPPSERPSEDEAGHAEGETP